MTTVNFIANVFQGGTAATGSSGAQSFTTGRHIIAVLYAQRNAHENGFGAGQWSLTDDASTNSPTWTQQGLSPIFTVDTDEIQIAVFTSDELTDTESITLTADASTGADTFRYRFSIYELIDWDGAITELVYDDHTGAGDDWVLNLAAAPVSGDAQILAGSTFGGGAANYDTAPTDWTGDNLGDQLVALSTTTATVQNLSYGKAGTQDAAAVRIHLAAVGDANPDAEQAAATFTATNPGAAVGPVAEVASAAFTATNPGAGVGPVAEVASAAFTAADPGVLVGPVAEVASAVFSAFDATALTSGDADPVAEVASMSFAAYDASVIVSGDVTLDDVYRAVWSSQRRNEST